MNFTVRSATTDDIGELCQLWSTTKIRFDPSAVERELVGVLRRDPELVLVATDETGIIGSVLGTFDGRRAWINRLATRPDRQQHGIATALMRELEQALLEKGARKVNLLIESENREVVSFYEDLGFSTDELIFMEKDLNSRTG